VLTPILILCITVVLGLIAIAALSLLEASKQTKVKKALLAELLMINDVLTPAREGGRKSGIGNHPEARIVFVRNRIKKLLGVAFDAP
jgi:hypothetical protein